MEILIGSGLHFLSGKERSEEMALSDAKCGQPWVGPVLFRGTTPYPYTTIGIRSCDQKGSRRVTGASVNLKSISDIVSSIKIGEQRKAYVVGAGGFLIAHPGIFVVLRKTHLSNLAHVKAAIINEVSEDRLGNRRRSDMGLTGTGDDQAARVQT